MALIVAHHRVKDFSAWKPFYDADKERRIAAGIHDWKLGTKPDDPNDVHMIWEVDDPQKVQEMMNDPNLKAVMEQAGVISPPEILIMLDPK